MKKYSTVYLLVIFLFEVNYVLSQTCSGRYDQEIFSSVNISSNVTYGSNTTAGGATQVLKLDVYEPDGDNLSVRPLIIWVHGGSFIAGTKNDIDVSSLCEHFAKRGYVCASIEYRLGYSAFPPNTKIVTEAVFRAVQDMRAAVRFFRKDAATANIYHIDPNMIFGGGSSAGAFTALHLAYLDEPSELPADIDTNIIGGFEGNSGNSGYPSTINAVIDLCGALGDKHYIKSGDIPFCAMHGDADPTVPYASSMIYVFGAVPVMIVDGSYSISDYANTIGVQNEMYTYYGAGHVPYAGNTAYMDTTVRFVSNFLFRYMGCMPSDPLPLANTFTSGVADISSENLVNVFPNPSSGKFIIDLNDNNKFNSIKLFSIDGKIYFEKNVFENTLSIENLSSGMYILELKSDLFCCYKKIVVR